MKWVKQIKSAKQVMQMRRMEQGKSARQMKPVNPKGIRIKIRSGLSLIIIAEALIICIISLFSIHLFYRIYADMLYNESAEVLNLYFGRVEDRLREIEKLSFSILADTAIQEYIAEMSDQQDTSEKYFAQTELNNKLLVKMFSVDDVFSINFIASGGQQVSVGYRSQNYGTDKLKIIEEIAYGSGGSNSWAIGISDEDSVSSIRLIRDIRKAGFRPLGTLVINLKMDDVMAYTSVVADHYKPDILVLDDGQVIYSNTGNMEALKFLPSDLLSKPYSIVKINGENYFISGRKSGYVNWIFVNILRCDEMLSSVNRLTRLILIVFALAVIVSLFIGLRFSEVISKSVVTLSKRMKKVENDEYDVEIAVGNGFVQIDEVEWLCHDFNIMVSRLNYLINDVYKKEIMIRETRYKVLQQQINPHFLYNTLDTINWMAQEKGNERISVMVKSLSSMFRASVGENDVITVEKELAILNNYVLIQKIRFEERLDFSVHIDQEFYQLLIPKMTIQPIVENSINYSLERYANVCVIRIEARNYENYAEISVSDNGPGMEEDFIQKLLEGKVKPTKTGIGLKNIDERLKLIFGDSYGIAIESIVGVGTRVSIRVPNDSGRTVPQV